MITVVREDSANRPFHEFCRKCSHCKVVDDGASGVSCKSKPKMQWVYDSNYCKTPEDLVLRCENMARRQYTRQQLEFIHKLTGEYPILV